LKFWRTQYVIVTFIALSTLDLKCLKILHLFFSEQKTFFYHKLPLFMLKSYLILFIFIWFLFF
jgi:hypothetical protein